MKKFTLLILLSFSTTWLMSQNTWINELHYDDSGGDQDEVVEFVIENPENYTLSLFEVFLYNGASGEWYSSESADNFTVGNTEGSFTIYYWYPGSIQNGAPDGLALSYDGLAISGQFLSYEGTFTATNGPANGLISTDMGVSESGVPEGQSLQLSGTGTQYSDFAWQQPATSTVGALNNSQSFGSGGNQGPVITNIVHAPEYPSSSETVVVTATVTDDNVVSSVVCNWGTTDGGPYPNTISMSIDAGDSYQTDSDIPAQPDGTSVYFVIEATDDEAETTTSPQQSYLVADVTIVINEILADPDAIDGDANGDGTVSTSQDEFVEIVNSTTTAIDISQFTLSDAVNVRHTYPVGTILQPNDAVVVFGGGTPTGFDYYDVQTASSGSLGLNNGGDDVILKDASGTVVTNVTFGSEGGDNQSITRDPDFTGEFVKHSTATGSGGTLFSPNKTIDGNWFKAVTLWNGSQATTTWEDSDNWSNNFPDADSRAVIPSLLSHYPTLTVPGPICNSLLIESDASLVGVNYLSVNGFSKVHRSIDEYSGSGDGFHFLSAPVSGFIIAGSYFEPVSGSDDFYDWDETNNSWLNYFGGNFTDTEFLVGKGYLVAYVSQNDGEFFGDLNMIPQTQNLSFTTAQGEGWNLLGNPFPSALDWDLLTKSVDVDGSVYVLKGSDNTYVSWNGTTGDLTDGHIPVTNGFFAKAGSASQSITMEAADQVHGSSGFLKNTNSELPANTLKVSIANEDFLNNTYIQFREDATGEFDQAFDAYKLFGSSDGPQLFTSISGVDYSINCLPFSLDEFELALGFITGLSGTFSISSEGSNSFQDGDFDIYIEDMATGDLFNLGEEQYTFTAESEGNENRFMLHFYGVTGIGESISDEDVKIYAHDKTVYFKFKQVPHNPIKVEVINTMGRYVFTGELEGTSLSSLRLDQNPGVYIIRVQMKDNFKIQKVFIK